MKKTNKTKANVRPGTRRTARVIHVEIARKLPSKTSEEERPLCQHSSEECGQIATWKLKVGNRPWRPLCIQHLLDRHSMGPDQPSEDMVTALSDGLADGALQVTIKDNRSAGETDSAALLASLSPAEARLVKDTLKDPAKLRPIPTEEELTGNPPPTDAQLRRWMKDKKIAVLERVDTWRSPGEMSPPLCCVGSCLSTATWRFAAAPPIKLPYCDRHLPARASAPAWTLRFAPVGNPHKSQVSSYELLKVIEQGFADGATEVTVRRAS